MFTIGEFAALGRVSVRMLRHYDAIGLLVPAQTGPVNGYRYYRAEQLRRLNRVIALKDLGFTLDQVAAILDDAVSASELHGMLRLRRAQLEAQLAADTARLARVEARLRMIDTEGRMFIDDVVLKQVPATRVAELSTGLAGYDGADIGPALGPLYREVMHRVAQAGLPVSGTPIAYYEDDPDGAHRQLPVRVHAAVEVAAGTAATDGLDVLDLPGLASAATIVHRGPMDEAGRSMQTLAGWIEQNGYRTVGYAREVCLAFDPQDPTKWVHELQLEVTRG